MELDAYFFILTLFCFTWGAIEDIKDRIIPDKVWLIQITGSIPLLIIWFTENQEFLPRVLVASNIVFGFILLFSIYFTRAMGGADAKALLSISISSPVYISLFDQNSHELIPPFLFFFLNYATLILVLALAFLIWNLYSIGRYGPLFGETSGRIGSKISILFSGRRIPKDKVPLLKNEDPAEIFDGDWKLFAPIFEEDLSDEEFELKEKEAKQKAWEDIQDSNRTYLWSRPQPPGLLFFTLAYLWLIFFGSPYLSLF